MTVRELCAQEGVNLCYFDGTGWHSPGFFNPTLKLLAIDINLSEQDQKQVALHELGHKEHSQYQYNLNREMCELQADRNMIHYLLEEELKTMDDISEFNYVHFMEKYNLKTIANETMVKEEYLSIINHIKGVENEF
nr:MAG TPA: IrrE protein [Caudoviricetes sp.]